MNIILITYFPISKYNYTFAFALGEKNYFMIKFQFSGLIFIFVFHHQWESGLNVKIFVILGEMI